MVLQILFLVFGSIFAAVLGAFFTIRYRRYVDDMKDHKEEMDEEVLDPLLEDVNHQLQFLEGRGLSRYVTTSGRDDCRYRWRKYEISIHPEFPPSDPIWAASKNHWPTIWAAWEEWHEELEELDSRILNFLDELREELVDDELSWGRSSHRSERAKRDLIAYLWDDMVRRNLDAEHQPDPTVQSSDPVGEVLNKTYRSPRALHYGGEILVTGEKEDMESLKDEIHAAIENREYQDRLQTISEVATGLYSEGDRVRDSLKVSLSKKTISNRCDLCPKFFTLA